MLEGLGARALAAGLRACGLPPWAELDEGSRQALVSGGIAALMMLFIVAPQLLFRPPAGYKAPPFVRTKRVGKKKTR